MSNTLRDAILKVTREVSENQANVAHGRLEDVELKSKTLQDFLNEVKATLGDIKYLTDYKLKLNEEVKTGYEGVEDIVEQAVLEHKDDNTYKAIIQLLRIKSNITKLEQLLIKAKVLQDDNSKEVLPSFVEARRSIEDKLGELEKNRIEIISRNSEAYTMYHLMQLSEWRKQITGGKIVETDSVHKIRLEVEEVMREGKPIFFKGPPGTGKTELAKHVAQIIHKDKIGTEKSIGTDSFRIVSCNRDMQYSELAGNKSIKATENGMETAFDYGPMYECMEKGIPIILDEVNALPAETLLKINEYLTRRPGDVIRVQENGGKEIEIKKGFCFVFTGNVGANYQGRFRLESSFINRMGLVVDYDYLPNASGVTDSMDNPDSVSGSELWHIMLVKFMNDKGIMHMPAGDMQKFWNMSKAVRRCQDVFSGAATEFTMANQSGDIDDISVISEKVKNNPISIRDVENIVSEYSKDSFMPLDYYIMRKFIAEKTDDKSRPVYLDVFKSFGFFTPGSGCEYEIKNGKASIAIDDAKLLASRRNIKYETYSSRDTVALAFGPAPEMGEPEISEIEERVASKMSPAERERITREIEEKRKLKEVAMALDDIGQLLENNDSPQSPESSTEFLQNLKQSGYLDTTYGLEGILSLTIPPELKQKLSKHDTAIKAFKEADNSSSYWIWGELEKHGMPLAPLLDNLEVITLNFNNNEEIRKDSNKIIAEMDKLGLRPLTYSELLATGILHPEVNKRNEYLVALGTTHTLVGGLCVPFLDWVGGWRSLVARPFSDEWGGRDRFPCVRK